MFSVWQNKHRTFFLVALFLIGLSFGYIAKEMLREQSIIGYDDYKVQTMDAVNLNDAAKRIHGNTIK